jgi:hypothetical protein
MTSPRMRRTARHAGGSRVLSADRLDIENLAELRRRERAARNLVDYARNDAECEDLNAAAVELLDGNEFMWVVLGVPQ